MQFIPLILSNLGIFKDNDKGIEFIIIQDYPQTITNVKKS